MAKTQYLDLTGLQTLVTQIKTLNTATKTYAGTLPEDATQTNVLDYVLAQIAASEFSGDATDVAIADEGNLITATDVEGALAEIAGNVATIAGTGDGSFDKAIKTAIGELKVGDTTYATVKAYVDALNAAVLKLIHGETGSLEDLETEDKSNLVAAINEVAGQIADVDYSGKADKVTTATESNFVAFTADGNIKDSGKKAADFEVAGAAAAVSGYAEDEDAKTVKDVAGEIAALGTASTKDFATADIADESEDTNLVSAAQVAKYVKGSVAGLEGALHFKGVKTSTDEVENPTSGDVVIVGTTEYIYDGSAWKEIGDEGLYVPNTRTIAGEALTANITATSLKTALDIDDLETAVGTASVEGGAAGTGLTKRVEDLEEGLENIDVSGDIQDAIDELDLENTYEAKGAAAAVSGYSEGETAKTVKDIADLVGEGYESIPEGTITGLFG